MESIQARLAQKKSASRKTTIQPGDYLSKVINVMGDNRYKDGAYVISYELQGKDKKFVYEERFIDNLRFKRTRVFYEYLADNGIEQVEDLVGGCEELELRWIFTSSGKRELTIKNRTFLGFLDDLEDPNEAEGNRGEQVDARLGFDRQDAALY